MFRGNRVPSLSPFKVDRAQASLLQSVLVHVLRFIVVKGPQRMRLPGSPTYILRNLGLEIFVFILIRLWFGLSPEPTKPVVKKSLWVAFSRCLIHILPVTVSLVLFRLNLGGFYIGHGFSQQSSDNLTDQGNDVKLALIQVAAKVQVFHALQYWEKKKEAERYRSSS